MTCAKKKLDKLGEDERKEFRSTLQSIMKEAKETNAVIKKSAGIVYVDSRDRSTRMALRGQGGEQHRTQRWRHAIASK